MTERENAEAVHRFADRLALRLNDALADTFTGMSPLQVRDGSDELFQESIATFSLIVNGALSGMCLVEFRESSVEKLVAKAGSNPTDAFAGRHEELFQSVMEIVSDGLTTSLSSNGGMVTVKLGTEVNRLFEAKTTVSLIPVEEGRRALQVLLRIDSELLDGIWSLEREGSSVESASRQVVASNLELVMDVELSVSLRFGQCKMLLRDVLELRSGYVVQLDRQVDDPVELVLDGKVIARGEAVVIDGNYGLRVTELSGPGVAKYDRPAVLSR